MQDEVGSKKRRAYSLNQSLLFRTINVIQNKRD